MSRSSELYSRARGKYRVKKLHEHSEDFLDFNQFGVVSELEDGAEKTLTLDEFVNLDIFTTENVQKALLALKNNEEISFENETESVKMSSSDNETVTISYGDIELQFAKHDLLNAFQEILDVELNEDVDDMPSVLKFKEYHEIVRVDYLKTKQNHHDPF